MVFYDEEAQDHKENNVALGFAFKGSCDYFFLQSVLYFPSVIDLSFHYIKAHDVSFTLTEQLKKSRRC